MNQPANPPTSPVLDGDRAARLLSALDDAIASMEAEANDETRKVRYRAASAETAHDLCELRELLPAFVRGQVSSDDERTIRLLSDLAAAAEARADTDRRSARIFADGGSPTTAERCAADAEAHTDNAIILRRLAAALPALLEARKDAERLRNLTPLAEPIAWLIVREDGSICDGAEMGSRASAEATAARYMANSGRSGYTVEPLYRAAAGREMTNAVPNIEEGGCDICDDPKCYRNQPHEDETPAEELARRIVNAIRENATNDAYFTDGPADSVLAECVARGIDKPATPADFATPPTHDGGTQE